MVKDKLKLKEYHGSGVFDWLSVFPNQRSLNQVPNTMSKSKAIKAR